MGILANNFALSTLIVAISFALLLYLSLKGYNLLFSGIVCAAIASLASQTGFVDGFTNTFLSGFTTLASMMFLVVMSGAFMSAVMERTGVAQKLGDVIVGLVGEKYVVIALIIYCMLLDAIGIGVSTFVFYAVAMPICRKANIPKSIPFMCFMGTNAIMLSTYAVPSPGNNMLATFFGYSLYDTPLLSITTGVVGIAIIIFMCLREQKKAHKAGEGFEREGEILMLKPVETRSTEECPSTFMAFLPCVMLLVMIPLLQNFTEAGAAGSAIIAQLIVGIFIILVNWKRFTGNKIHAITESLLGPVPILMSAFCIAGYGAVISSTLFYERVLDMVLNSNVPAYVLVVIVVMVVCGITGDAAGGSAIIMTTIGEPLMAAGANPAVLGRLTGLTAQTFDSLPHSYMVALNLQVFGHDIKSGYKYAFRTTVVATLIVAMLGLALALIFY